MEQCKVCQKEINEGEVLCSICNKAEDLEIAKMIEDRRVLDNGTRYSLEEVQEIEKIED